MIDADALVIGGGIAGASLPSALEDGGLNAALLAPRAPASEGR